MVFGSSSQQKIRSLLQGFTLSLVAIVLFFGLLKGFVDAACYIEDIALAGQQAAEVGAHRGRIIHKQDAGHRASARDGGQGLHAALHGQLQFADGLDGFILGLGVTF